MVKLTATFLGTSAAAPTKTRALPSVMLQREGEILILDAGEGVQRQIMETGVGLNRETVILITHLHGDHVAGLLGLLWSMGLAGRTRQLTIVGPAPLARWLSVTSEILHMGLGTAFPVKFVSAHRGLVLRLPHFNVRAERASHSVECFAYVLEEKPRPGIFHPEIARRLGVPEGKLWSRLQRGKDVTVNGKRTRSSDVVGPPRPGRRVGYSGDTRPTRALERFFAGCDLLIFDSTYGAGDSDKALEYKHSTSVEAATLASSAKAKRLALTHFSARYTSVARLLKEARSVFPNTFAAHDGLKVEVEYPVEARARQPGRSGPR
ncbi:MAG: ribonuclease Z [Nitrososphaerota archaeon]|nr:ribonuclease Z [Nitrososphaerota archaeon]